MGWTNTWIGAVVLLIILAAPIAVVVWFMRRPSGLGQRDEDPDTVAKQGKDLGPTGRVRPK